MNEIKGLINFTTGVEVSDANTAFVPRGEIVTISGGLQTSKANISLNNLASTAVNTCLIPATSGAQCLGTSAYPWKDLYVGGLFTGNSFQISGNSLTATSGGLAYNGTLLNFFEEVNGQIQPKTSLAGDTFRIGSPASTYTVAGSGGTAGFGNIQGGISFTGNYWTQGTVAIDGTQTTDSNPYVTTASSYYDDAGKYLPYKGFDGSTSVYPWVSTVVGNVPHWWGIDFLTTKTLTAARFFGNNNGIPADYLYQGSNDTNADWTLKNWTTLKTVVGDTSGTSSWSDTQAFTTTGAFRFYRMYISAIRSDLGSHNANFWEIQFYQTSTGTVDTPDLVTGTPLSFAPSTFRVYDDTYVAGGNNVSAEIGGSNVNVYYTTDGNTWSSALTVAQIQALSPTLLSSLSILRFRIQPVGTQKVSSCSIQTTSSELIFSPLGTMTANINGSPVWVTTAEGDQTSVDMTVASLSASGLIAGNSFQISGNSLTATSGGLAYNGELLNFFEEIGGKIQPKQSLNSFPFRIGTEASSFNIEGSGGPAGFTNAGGNVVYESGYWRNTVVTDNYEFNYGNFATGYSTSPSGSKLGYTISADTDLPPYWPAWGVFDAADGDGVRWGAMATATVANPNWLRIDLSSAAIVSAYRWSPSLSHGSYYAKDWVFQGWTGSQWDTLHSISGYGGGASPLYTFDNATSYISYRFYCTAQNLTGGITMERFKMYLAISSTTNNTFDTPDIATGENFDPSSFVVYDESNNEITDYNTYNMTFRRVNESGTTDFSGTLIKGSDFRALLSSDFTACNELKFRIQPVGSQKIGKLYIETTSAALTIYPQGYIVANINGVDVWTTTADGDQTSVDMTVSSLSASGLVSANSLQISGNSLTATSGGLAYNGTLLNFFEEVNGNIQPKASLAGDSFRIGSPALTYTIAGSGGSDGFTNPNTYISYTSNYWSNALTQDAFPFNNGTPNTDATTPYTVTVSSKYDGTETYAGWKALDGTTTGHGWLTVGGQLTGWIKIDTGSARTITEYQLYSTLTASRSPKNFTLQGSNTGTSNWVTVDTRTGQTYTGGSTVFTVQSPGSYRYYMLDVTLNNGDLDVMGIAEIQMWQSAMASSDNTVDTPDLIIGSSVNISPATLVVKDGTGATIGDTTYNVAYSTDGTNYSSLITGTAFKALSTSLFANLTILKLRLQPVGGAQLGSLLIQTTSSELIFSPLGTMTANINGSPVWVTTAEGDQTSVDMTVASVSASNTIVGGTLKSNTVLQLAETTTPISASNVGQVYTKSDNNLYFKNGDGGEDYLALNNSVVGISSTLQSEIVSISSGYVHTWNGRYGNVLPLSSDYTYYAECSTAAEFLAAMSGFAASPAPCGTIEIWGGVISIGAGTLSTLLTDKKLTISSTGHAAAGATAPGILFGNASYITLHDSEIEYRGLSITSDTSSTPIHTVDNGTRGRVTFLKCTGGSSAGAAGAIAGAVGLRQILIVNVQGCTFNMAGGGYLVSSATANTAIASYASTRLLIQESTITGKVASSTGRWGCTVHVGGGCKVIDAGAGCWNLTPGAGSATLDLTYDGLGSQVSLALVSGSSALTSVTNTANLDPVLNSLQVSGSAIIEGGLTVRGTTVTINTQELTINDNIITLNSNITGAEPFPLDIDSGIQVNRGSETAARLLWDESANRWVAGISGSEQVITLQSDLNGLDALYVNITGDTMTGKFTLMPSTSSYASFNIPTGLELDSQSISGDIWRCEHGLMQNSNGYVRQIDRGTNTVGAITKVSISANPDGTVNVPASEAYLYSNTDWSGHYRKWTLPAISAATLTDLSTNYLIANYNNGVPAYLISTNPADINNSNKALVASMSREGTVVHYIPVDWGLSTAMKLNNKEINTRRFERSSGLTLTANVSGAGSIEVSSGVVWYGASSIVESSTTSAISGAVFYYHSGSSWTRTLVSTYNNTQYDNGTGLQTLGAGRYAVNWIYRYIDGDNLPKLAYVLGNGNYRVDEAKASTIPTIPVYLDRSAILVGRIIVQKGEPTPVQVDSAFTVVFTGTSIQNHNDLGVLQGGASNEYYHLSATQYSDHIGRIEVAGISGNLLPINAPATTNTVYDTNIVSLNRTFSELGTDTKMSTGIPWDERGKFKTDITVSGGMIMASITGVGANTTFSYYINDKKYDVTDFSSLSKSVSGAEGTWYYYINQSNVPTLTQVPWSIYEPDVLLWNFSYDSTNSAITWVGEERHTAGRDIYQHARNHFQGAIYRNGFTASAYNGIDSTNLASNTNNNPGRALVQIAGGSFFDEDILNNIVHTDASISSTVSNPSTNWNRTSEQFLGFTALAAAGTNTTTIVFPTTRTLVTGQVIMAMAGNTTTARVATGGVITVVAGGTGTSFTITPAVTGLTTGDAIVVPARIPIYHIATGGQWRKLTTTDFLGATGTTTLAPYTSANIASAVASYNLSTGGGSAVTGGRFYPVFICATNFTSEPVIAILGQGQSTNTTLATALTEAPFQFQNLVGLSSLGIQEIVPIYRLTYNYNSTGSFTNTRIKLVNATFIDIRVSTASGSVLGASPSTMAASNTTVDSSVFTKNLGTNDNTVQLALNTLDQLSTTKTVCFGVGDGVNVVVSGGIPNTVRCPVSGTLSKVTLISDISGSMVLDVWKASDAMPTVANTMISGDNKPTLSGNQIYTNTTLTGWTTTITAGDIFKIHVDSTSLIKHADLFMDITV
jgi:hypothetical protein